MGNALLGRNNLTALLSPVLRYGLPQGVLMGYDGFIITQCSQLPVLKTENVWLVERLWPRSAIGILAAPPKSYKTWLCLDMAISVASGTDCLGRYATQRGKVLYVPGEGRPERLRSRIEGIAQARGVEIDGLNLFVMEQANRLVLDNQAAQNRFEATLEKFKPDLVIIDPLRRLFDGDENASAAISPVLNFLTAMQQKYACAILVVHHTRKDSAGGATDGQSLRGSSDLYGWGESFLYISKTKNGVRLVTEHRDEESDVELHLKLEPSAPSAVLAIDESIDAAPTEDAHPAVSKPSSQQRVIRGLSELGSASKTELRDHIQMKNETLVRTIDQLLQAGVVVKDSSAHYSLSASHEPKTQNLN